MGDYYFDDNDLNLAIIFSDFSSPIAIVISLVVILSCAGLIYVGTNQCSDLCDPAPSQVLDNSCYCVQEDGSLMLRD